ncbi:MULTISPECIES: HPF/RaiA family ribosome-associated protein [unclassified Kitasatospora]|uniref:HPF/RaiA family ribosome-associated protein n=1 Tax=unclassified Kitasatospora TaxID=2633591 RepID=UPI0033FF00FE
MPEIEVEVRGEMPPDSAEYARTMVRAVARHAHEPVRSVRVRLTQGRDPEVRRSAVARASLDVSGRPAHARVAAETMHEAIDLLRGRLDYRLARLEHWARWSGGLPVGPSDWSRRGGAASRH